MKVTVCFGAIRVVVPCGTGDLLVRDLVQESIRRYRKAVGKDSDQWVVVHHLQSQSGILDPDDRVSDVADDREQILASFDDGPGPEPPVPQGGGDGASGSSSVGTGSPDIFKIPVDPKYHADDNNSAASAAAVAAAAAAAAAHIEVTGAMGDAMAAGAAGLGLQVRRSSDPSLHHPSGSGGGGSGGGGCSVGMSAAMQMQNGGGTVTNGGGGGGGNSYLSGQPDVVTKRWSAAPVCRTDSDVTGDHAATTSLFMRPHDKRAPYLSPSWETELERDQDTGPASFSRSGRLSMQFLGDGGGYRWMDAAERVQGTTATTRTVSSVNAPIASVQFSSKSLPRELKRREPLGAAYESIREKDGEMLLVVNETGGPLGLTAIPDPGAGGLLVQAVEAGSRAERGRLRRGDRIVEINGCALHGLTETAVQEHLRKSLSASELRLRVMRAKVATVSPNRKPAGSAALLATNTRRPGRRIEIALLKGAHGLGFSVTTRDNPAGGHCPVYIKTILPHGAAIEDGRLRPGDRLLEVDNTPMTGKTQSDVVGLLRATETGATVRIVVSRQQDPGSEAAHAAATASVGDEREIGSENSPPKPPPPILPASKEAATVGALAWRNRDVLTLHIPVHDTEKAGLGVSVKGKTGSTNSSWGSNTSANSSSLNVSTGLGGGGNSTDLGIFVKSVLHGGAASRDGRLRTNDQLLSVNGASLLGQTNAEAMETLRRAMLHHCGQFPGMITLTVARKMVRSGGGDSSSVSESSGATVIYLGDSSSGGGGGKEQHNKRWSNPVLDRLTGGGHAPAVVSSLRNESYYMATGGGGGAGGDSWSASCARQQPASAAVLIEEDPAEPSSPISTIPIGISIATKSGHGVPHIGDITYASQLSLDASVSSAAAADAFSRDAIGRRSISEKHHAALDARETGTYQRNRKLREERERERRIAAGIGSSVDSLAAGGGLGIDLRDEAMDRVADLGPSLGLKKSSSLESLQTMVQELQLADEPSRGPTALRTPRGRGRDESLRAAVERPPETKARKHWLLEEGPSDTEGGFIAARRSPFQSSMHDGKPTKVRPAKKQQSGGGLLRGIGHMFRFGRHRKDGIAPAPSTAGAVSTQQTLPPQETLSDFGGRPVEVHKHFHPQPSSSAAAAVVLASHKMGPPLYQPPPAAATNAPAPATLVNGSSVAAASASAIHQNDIFNHRYSHYANYEELQQQMRRYRRGVQSVAARSRRRLSQDSTAAAITLSSALGEQSPPSTSSCESPSSLSESTIVQMRMQVMNQRSKVEEESRRNQHYHSQRSARSVESHHSSGNHHQVVHPSISNHHHLYQHQQHTHYQKQQQQQQQQYQQHHQQHHQQQPQQQMYPQQNRPLSSYNYDYETIPVQGGGAMVMTAAAASSSSSSSSQPQHHRKHSAPAPPRHQWSSQAASSNGGGSGGSTRSHRGPFVTQVMIRDQSGGGGNSTQQQPPASKV